MECNKEINFKSNCAMINLNTVHTGVVTVTKRSYGGSNYKMKEKLKMAKLLQSMGQCHCYCSRINVELNHDEALI